MGQLEIDWGKQPARKPTPEPVQLAMAHVRPKGRGGPRPGSGRKPGVRPTVLHRVRGEHRGDVPLLITLRRAKTMSSLRTARAHHILRDTIRATQRETFRIVHYSVQSDHVHLLVEADDAESLSNAMRSFTIRAAVRINYELFGRRQGTVWTDRYRTRELTTPAEAREALRFVLANDLKHGDGELGVRDGFAADGGHWVIGRNGGEAIESAAEDTTAVVTPRTRLMRDGWATGL